MPSFSMSFVRDVLLFAASQSSSDLDHLCAQVCLSRTALNRPDDLIPGPVAERVWQLAIAETGDLHFGLQLGAAAHPAALGLLGLAMLSCETFGAALDRATRYWNLLSDAIQLRQRREGKHAVIELAPVDLPDNFLLRSRHPAESSLAAILSIAHHLTGRALPVTEVATQYPPPADPREHQRIFGILPRFETESNWVRFDAVALAWPLLQTNSQMDGVLQAQLQQHLEAKPQDIVSQVRHEVAARLRGDMPTLATVAKALHRSARAVQRDLQSANTTYRKVIDDLRRDLAQQYLRQPSHSIADIAFLFGFSEPSAFHRSFRNWTGQTPRASRRLPATARTIGHSALSRSPKSN